MNPKIKDSSRAFLPVDLATGTLHWMHVTHIINPQNFYARPISSSYYLNDVMADKLSHEVRADDIQIGDIITYKSPRSTSKLRGKIMYILHQVQDGTNLFDIYAIDHGFSDKNVKEEDIWACDSNCSQIPPLAVCCELEHCYPPEEEWSKESIEAFVFYVGNEKALITIRGINDDKLVVELVNTTEDIAKIMALTSYSKYVGVQNKTTVSKLSQPLPTKMFYKQKIINIGDVLHVRVLNGKLENFFVAEQSDYLKLRKQMTDIRQYAKHYKPIKAEDIEVNMPVLVNLNTYEFERGLIQKVITAKRQVRVELIDLGKAQYVAFQYIRPIPESCLSYPIAFECCAANALNWINNENKVLMRGNVFNITIKELRDETEPFIVNITPTKQTFI